MAEIPDLGEHCALRGCNQIDYLPFQCESCKIFYCRTHRLPDQHACVKSIEINNGKIQKPNTDENKFLCSMRGCFVHERTRIQCDRCGHNFCMRHRICEDHSCECLSKSEVSEKPVIQLPIIKKKDNKMVGAQPKEKKLSAEQQSRLDRINILKLKAKNPLKLAPEQQHFLFANIPDGGRHLVMVSNKWSLLKALWHVAGQLGLGNSEDFNAYKTLLSEEEMGSVEPLPLNEFVAELLPNESDFLLIRKKK